MEMARKVHFFWRGCCRAILVMLAGAALGWPLAQAADTSGQTRYPVVLVHGMSGWDSMLGYDYWYGIPQAMRDAGTRVYVAEVSGFNSTEVRGEQLLTQIRNILAVSGAQKVNLIGHSHGGPTIRYAAGVAPDLVASVTSVGGVNQGSAMADFVDARLQQGSLLDTIVVGIVKSLGQAIGWLSGKEGMPEVPRAGLASLTTAGSQAFNARFPQGLPQTACGDGPGVVNGVRYYSWTGNAVFTNVLDPLDYGLSATAALMGTPANDGLVSVCSSRLGTSLGVYRQNHLDEVNQVAGIPDWFSADPVSLYVAHARRLKSAGL